jgi:SAM-dependent methyltransferase
MVSRSTDSYAENAAALAVLYEGLAFDDVHRDILHLIPATRGCILDIGAGTGRDAAALASRGHRAVAVEPTAELRAFGQRLHGGAIAWIDDKLPALDKVHARGERYDLILASGVWMHLDRTEREQAMARIADLLMPAATLSLSLRHGPVPSGRRMFEVSAAETTVLARAHGLEPAHHSTRAALLGQPGVWWDICAFCKTGRATAADGQAATA